MAGQLGIYQFFIKQISRESFEMSVIQEFMNIFQKIGNAISNKLKQQTITLIDHTYSEGGNPLEVTATAQPGEEKYNLNVTEHF